MPNVETRKRFIVNVMYLTLICVILYFVLKYLLVWMLPFVIGFLCSLLLHKPVKWLALKTKIPKGIWSVVLVTVILSAVFAVFGFVVYRIYNELLAFINALNTTLPSFIDSLKGLGDKISTWLDSIPVDLTESLSKIPGDLATKGVSYLSKSVSSFAINVPGLLISIIISIVACCFMTAQYSENTLFVLRQFSVKNQEIIIKTKNLFIENIGKMIKGYILIMFITFIELFIGLSLLNIEYALILALLIAFLDILPVLGTGTILIPWCFIEFVTGDFVIGIELLILYGVITVIRNIIEPKIIGKQVGLPPIVTLMAMYLGLTLFGVFGMFGLPIILIILVKLQELKMIKIWK